MTDKDFDKLFGDKMKEERDFTFTENKWLKMEKHYESYLSQKRLLRLGLVLALPLLLALGWVGNSLVKTQQQVVDLTHEMMVLKERQSAIGGTEEGATTPSVKMGKIEKNDTIYHKIVVYRYDTIYQTVIFKGVSDKIISEKASNNKPNNRLDTQGKPIISSNNGVKTTVSAAQTPVIHKTDSIQKSDLTTAVSIPISTEKDTTQKLGFKDKILKNDSLKTLVEAPQASTKPAVVDTTQRQHPLSISKDSIEKTAEKVVEDKEGKADEMKAKGLPLIRSLKFKIAGYEAGLTSGVAFIDNKAAFKQTGFSTGIRGSVLLTEKWRVMGEGQYVSLSYQADRIHEALDIPQITPPSPFDDFEEVVVKQPYWQASLGMQYALSSKRLKPYLGVSILGQSKSHERFEYHFTNRLTKQDESVQLSRHDGDFEIRYMRFHAGAEYPVLKRFKTLLESSYDLNLGHAPQYKPLWNVKMGILYRL